MKNTQTMLKKDKIPPLSQEDLMENLPTKYVMELAQWAEDRKVAREAKAKKG